MDPIATMTVSGFLEQLASKSPTPGGGAAAAATGATAAALAGMVLAYSVNRRSLAEHREMLEEALARTTEARAEMLALGDEDAEAYAALNELQKLDENDERRVKEESDALIRATAVPARVMELASELLGLFESLVGKTNPHLRSDLAIAAALAESACASAAWNVRINAPGLPETERAATLGRAETAVRLAGEARVRIERGCQ
jgi:formiminotetrahydrofolate cyclodeaminase